MILSGGHYGGQSTEELGVTLKNGSYIIDGWKYNEEGIFVGMA